MDIVQLLHDFVASFGLTPFWAKMTSIGLIAVAAVVGYFLTLLILSFVQRLVLRTETTWDDDLVTPKFMEAVSQLTPALVVAWLLPSIFHEGGKDNWLYIATRFYILWATIRIVVIFIGNLYHALEIRENLSRYAVKGVFQMLKLVAIAVGIIVGVSLIIGRSPITIITALGASAAILMLVFKDTILGLVASIQLTANKMLHRGDWVEMPGHLANGEVEDITLTAVKIRNWDNSITTIPPYAMISESFKNYQPMREGGGRRVSRWLNIDLNSIRFLSKEELDSLREEGWLEGLELDETRPQSNLRLLRLYLEQYLETHEMVRTDMLHMVRQLQPTTNGVPLELYFFTSATVWKDFERVQSDIFDNVYAIVNRFGLRAFQSPAGTDLAAVNVGLSNPSNSQQ